MISDQIRRRAYAHNRMGFRPRAIAAEFQVQPRDVTAILRDARIRREMGWGIEMKHWIVIRAKNVPCPCGCHGAHPHHFWRYPRRVLMRTPTEGRAKLPWTEAPVTVRLVQVGLFEGATWEWRIVRRRDYPRFDGKILR